jgi:chaperonin GroEL
MKAIDSLKLEGDEKVGAEIVLRALEEPLRQIANNAGWEGSIVVQKVKESKDVNFGFNAETEAYGDMIKEGVIDPTKVTRVALENAASVAGLLLMTETTVVEKPEKEKHTPPMPPGGGMY